MVQIFLQSMLIGYSGALMPGSLLTYTIDKSIKSGAKSGLLIILGHSLLELLLVILIFTGAGSLLGTQAAQTVIGLLGGLVLIYLGITMIRDVVLNKITVNFETGRKSSRRGMVIAGALISAANPYFILWWTIVGLGLILSAYKAFGITGIVLFYIGHMLADMSWYCLVSFLVSRTRKFIKAGVYRMVIVILGICLLGFGAGFIINSIKHLTGGIA